MDDYELQIRDPRTLELGGVVRDYAALWYERTAVDPGRFELVVHLDELPDPALAAAGGMLVVLRDGAPEFAGVIERREFHADERTWTLGGPDLLGFFAGRYWPELAAATGAAETVAKSYVTAHGLAAWQGEIDPTLPFEVQGDQGRGGTVTVAGRRGNLDRKSVV